MYKPETWKYGVSGKDTFLNFRLSSFVTRYVHCNLKPRFETEF